jgi:hypothetical protein
MTSTAQRLRHPATSGHQVSLPDPDRPRHRRRIPDVRERSVAGFDRQTLRRERRDGPACFPSTRHTHASSGHQPVEPEASATAGMTSIAAETLANPALGDMAEACSGAAHRWTRSWTAWRGCHRSLRGMMKT